MPRLACRSCGRQVFAASSLEALFPEERRCPRCGALLDPERRTWDRRSADRRVNPPDRPGPPPGMAERRVGDRRREHRRHVDGGGVAAP